MTLPKPQNSRAVIMNRLDQMNVNDFADFGEYDWGKQKSIHSSFYLYKKKKGNEKKKFETRKVTENNKDILRVWRTA